MADLWEQAAQEYKPQSGAAAPSSPSKKGTSASGDPFEQAANTYESTAAVADNPEEEGTLSKAWRWVNTPLTKGSANENEKLQQAKDYSTSVPTLNESEHPYWTSIKKGLAGAYGDTLDTVRGFTSPLGVTTLAAGPISEAGGALGKIASVGAKLAGIGFAAGGAKEAYEGGIQAADEGITPETSKKVLGGLGQVAMGAAAPLHGTEFGNAPVDLANVKKVAASPVRGAAKTYNVAREAAALPGYMVGGIKGAKIATAVGKVIPEAGENLTMAGYSAPDRLVLNQETITNEAQQRFAAADKQRAKYTASEAQGVPAPPEVVKEYNESEAQLAEARKHLDIARDNAARIKAGQPAVKAPGSPLGAIQTPEEKPVAETGEALGGTPLKSPLGEIKTPASVPARESGEALAEVNPARSGELGTIGAPVAEPAAKTGEALGRIAVPEKEITPEEVKSSPGTSMSKEPKTPETKQPTAEKTNESTYEVNHNEIAAVHNQYGGSTFNPKQGNMVGKEAYAVSTHPELGEAVEGEKITPEQMKSFMEKPDVAKVLKENPEASIGTWSSEGKTHLDVVETPSDLEKAKALAAAHKQIAIYDLKNGTEIKTGETGSEQPPPNPEAKVEPKGMSEEDAADFDHHVNNTTPMGPTPLKALREFAAENTDKPVKYFNAGGEASVFDLGNGNVMRVSTGEVPTVPDIPEVLKPIASKEVEGATGKFHATIFTKVETKGITAEDVNAMTKQLADKGYTWDAGDYNLGKTADGKTVIIDPGGIKEIENTASKAGPASEEDVQSARNILKDHTEQQLIKAGKEYGVDHSDYDFAKRDERRHRVDRDRFVNDVVSKMPDEAIQKLVKAEGDFNDEDSPLFSEAERSSSSKAARAKAIWDAAHSETEEVKLDLGKMKAKGPAPEATTETAKMSDEELLKKGFTQEDIESGLHLPKAGGGAETGAKAAKEIPEEADKYLTPEERAGVNKSNAGRNNFVAKLAKLPSVQEFTDIALQGEGGRKWYQRGTKAFDSLTEEAPRYFKEGDRDKFIDLLASGSPQQTVAMNLKEALNVWTKYVDAGRPEGKKLETLLYQNFTLPDAKVPNAMKAFAGEDLWPDISKNNAFKVPSFAKNLKGWLNNVTNDGWMALFGGMKAGEISRPTSYHPLAIATRAAAEALGWEPAEAQAAIWAFTKAFTEQGETDPKMIRMYSEDFADIMANDPEIREMLGKLGVKHEQLDAKLKSIGEKPAITGRTTPTTENSIKRLSERIGKAGRELPKPKDQRGLDFTAREEDTEFNPADFEEKPEKLKPLGTKSTETPLGKIKKRK